MLKLPPSPPLSSSSSLTPSSSTVRSSPSSSAVRSATQCRFPCPSAIPHRRRRSFSSVAVSCSAGSSGSNSADLARKSKKESANGAAMTMRMIPLANQLRVGSLTEDGLSYKESFIVRSYEVGINKTATVETIANFLQSIPQEIIDTHELQSITLDYRRECQHDDMVDSLASSETADEAETMSELKGTNGSPTGIKDEEFSQFLHLLRLSSDGSEINRGRTEWRRKPPR